MAITATQYRNHLLLALKATIQAEPALLLPLLPGLVAYARTGADQREAIETLCTWAWQHLRPLQGFDPHAYKHLLISAGVPTAWAANVTERSEP